MYGVYMTRWSNETYDKWLKDNGKTFKRKEGETVKKRMSVIKHVCDIDGHEWETTIGNILNGDGCAACSGMLRWTNDSYDKWLKDNGRTFKRKSEVINSKLNIIHECDIDGHEWGARISNILKGTGCPKCALRLRTIWNNETYDKWLKDNGKTFKRKSGEVITGYSIVLHVCDIDGYEWETSPHWLINDDSGCPQCVGKRRWTTELYDKSLKDNGRTFRRKEGEEVVNGLTKMKHICEIDGYEWLACINDIINNGSGCPQCKSSKGETSISNYLKKNNYKFHIQFKFKDCKNKKPLPFDFWIPELNLLIEYQGIQHFEQCGFGSSNDKVKMLSNVIKRDNIKRNYCINNNINFIEIPYYEFDNIEKILDEKLGELKLLSNKAI